jgi:hypothetical protein
MKRQDSKNLGAKTGVSRLWLGVAALVGAATAYLGDPQRGGARREAAVRQVSSAAKSVTERASRWRTVVTARVARTSGDQLPQQVTIPTEKAGAARRKAPATTVPEPTKASAEPKKPGV